MTTTTAEETPRLYQHTCALYDQLAAGAKKMEDKSRVFEGSLVAAFRAIGVSQSYYSSLYGILKELGCITVQRSGRGGGGKSLVTLHHPPGLDEFRKVYKVRLTNETPYANLILRIENMEGRLPTIDLPSYIVDLEQRLAVLEDRIKSLERTGG